MDAYSYYLEMDSRLEVLSVEENAIAMKKYMRNHFEFYGIKSPDRKKAMALFKKEYGQLPNTKVEEFVHLCWDNPYREIQYSCMELLGKEKELTKDRIELYEWMVLRKSWWDSIDFIAPSLMGRYFQIFPEMRDQKTLEYVNSNELWLQRSALLFQLKYKEKTDLSLLFKYVEMLSTHPDFFIRKAIGWSLRQAGKSFPNEIRDFVNKTELSNLSRREALKRL